MITITGKATLTYDQPPRILEAASIVGQKEGDGPLSHLFDWLINLARSLLAPPSLW